MMLLVYFCLFNSSRTLHMNFSIECWLVCHRLQPFFETRIYTVFIFFLENIYRIWYIWNYIKTKIIFIIKLYYESLKYYYVLCILLKFYLLHLRVAEYERSKDLLKFLQILSLKNKKLENYVCIVPLPNLEISTKGHVL